MPIPGNLTTITVTGEFLDSNGNPMLGSVSFAPPVDIYDAAGAAIISRVPYVATLNPSTGAFSIVLPCTDNAAMNPTNWGYTVTINLTALTSGPYSYTNVSIPHTLGTSVDLTGILPPGVPTTITPNTYGLLAAGNTWAAIQTYQQASNGTFLQANVSGDTNYRFSIDTSGKHQWGSGTAALDTDLYRSAAGVLKTDGAFIVGGTLFAATIAPIAGLSDWINVKAAAYGAVGNGVADDTTAIQNALNATPLGGVVYLPAGTYATSAPLTIPPQVTLMGSHSSHIDTTTCAIKPLASFTGAAVISMVDQATGGYSVLSNQQRILGITLDGSNLTGSTIHGLQATGYVHGVILEDLQIYKMPSHGVAITSNGSGVAYSWRGTRIAANTCGSAGFSFAMTDCTWIDCEAIGNGGDGFSIVAQPSNSQFLGCRSEYNQNGFAFSGAWSGGNANGGGLMTGCTTDGNVRNGILITATGDNPLTIVGYYGRRDGSNGTLGGGSYAGINCTASTIPVTIDAPVVLTGIANGGGANSPQYGFSVTSSSSNVGVSNAVLYGATAAWNDDGTNTNIGRGANCVERVGTQASYTTTYTGLQVSRSGLDMVGEALGIPTPRDMSLIAWTFDPALAAGSSSDSLVTNGTQYLTGIYVSRSTAATKIYWGINTAASGVTAGQNWLTLYNSAGTLVTSVDISSQLTSTGGLTTTISTSNLTPGFYWVGVTQNATTPARLYRGSSLNNATILNMGTSAATKRIAANGTGITTTVPSPITPSSNASPSPAYPFLFGIGP